ncbi:DnaJ-like subfamily B member 12, partial [Mucuna pruriens]
MECNKDEAQRAKQIAENKMQAGDFEGALKFATKAQRLFPEIQNIVQIFAVCEVHCAAQKKHSGSDMDWYGILQTHRLADEATIKKQYRKLALLLHPDKNKSAGAEAAFKLIGEANRVLSDQMKRTSYDSRFGVSVGNTAPKVPPRYPNGNSFGTKCDGTARNHQNSFYSQSHGWNAYHRVENQTFWTCCPHCNTRYQYYKTILNHTIRCQQCSKSFTAHDMGNNNAPPGYWSAFNNQKEPPQQASPKEASKSNGGKSCGREQEGVSMSKCTAGVGAYSKAAKSRDGQATAGVKKAGVGTSNPTNSKVKESLTSTKVGCKRARQSTSDDDNKAGNGKGMKDTKVRENRVDPHRRSSRSKQHVSYTQTDKDGDFGSSSKRPRHHESVTTTEVEKREVPTTGGLSRKNNPASFTAGVGGQNGEVRNKASAPPEETVLRNKTKVEQTNVQRKEASNSDLNDSKSKADNCSPLKSNLSPNSEICCPDPDFSDFERDKAEDCFAVNQFWAIFDNTDSMPRFYALVKKVYSPFKLQITWLEPDSDDQGEIDWHKAGLPVACGKFKLGHSQRTTDRFMFSHQMHCIKGSETGTYLVYPKKGETWAIFRHWDIGWSSNPEKQSEYQFEYVEVLSDFDENVGIKVTYLGQLKGFVSLFQQTVLNGISLFCIPPNELYRFSHRIPSYKMTGAEREDVPRGSFELDPAGLPNSLFEVGDPDVVKMDGVNSSHHEQTMSNDSIHKAKLRESNDAERVSQILRRSPRSSHKSMDNGQASTSQYTVRKDDESIGYRDYSPPEGNPVASQTNERKVKTSQKRKKNNYGETLKSRKSPRDLSKKSAKGDAGEWTTGKMTHNHSNDSKNVKDNNIPQSVGAPCYGFKKEKSEEMFQCGQIWAIYGDRDNMPNTYAQIKKIELTPNFRLQVSALEPCSPPNDIKRTISCGTFKVKKAKLQILSLSAFCHQLKVEPMVNNIYEIYPRKGEIWALYKDPNYEQTSSNQGRGECHIVEVLSDSDKSIQVVVLMPHSNSQTIFKAPRIQRSRTGVIEILREEVGRFSHQIPAFQHSGEDNVHLRGCWELDPSSVPGSFVPFYYATQLARRKKSMEIPMTGRNGNYAENVVMEWKEKKPPHLLSVW